MGGHSAWRKRVAKGELAKQSGGAICRHRPHLGRKGKDLILNRKGYIGGGNPKKRKRHHTGTDTTTVGEYITIGNKHLPSAVLIMTWLVVLCSALVYLIITTQE